MTRRMLAWPTAGLLTLVLLGNPVAILAQGPDPLTAARGALDGERAVEAVTLLEEALVEADPPRRAELVKLLREAYPLAIGEAEAAGQTARVSELRENQAILLGQPTPAVAPVATPPAPAEPAPPAVASGGEAAIVEPPVEPPAEPPAAPLGGARPPVHPDGEPLPPVTEPVTPGPAPVEAAAPAADAATAPQAADRLPPVDVKSADAAFRARDYATAGSIYEALEKQGQLPRLRRDAWAYCRMVAVVERINGQPRSPADWQAIQGEIAAIKKVAPEMWYAEYLRNLAAELASKGRRSKDGKIVLRGAAPDDPAVQRAGAPAPASGPASRAARRAPADSPSPGSSVGQRGTPINGWQVWDTPSFRILHANEAVATEAARIAEATRQSQQRLWTGRDDSPAWQPRCDIYLYPSAAVFQTVTGQPADSPGFSTMGLDAGRVVARRVNLRADHPNLLKAILPHEVTHVVIADLFPNVQVPRWADEGMAVLAEPANEQALRVADLVSPLANGQVFAASDLVAMDYPDAKYWSLYYAQSVSLTRYLVELGTPAQFVEFIRRGQREGYPAALKAVYQLDSLDALQQNWLAYARGQVDATRVAGTLAAPPEGAAAAESTTRR